MLKRVLAWVLIVGFVLLLLNIVFFHVFQMQSVALYAIIAVWFIFSNKPMSSNKIVKTAEPISTDGLDADPEVLDENNEAGLQNSVQDDLDNAENTDYADNSDK